MRKILLLILLTQTYLFSQWSWINPLPHGNYINHLIYTGNQKLIAVGDYGTVMTSSNDGINWNITYKAEGNGSNILSYSKLNDNVVYFGTFAGGIYKTTNSGNSIFYLSNIPSVNVKAISAVSDLVLYVLSSSKRIYKSTNGGYDWVLSFQAGSVYELADICFVNENTGFAGGGIIVDGSTSLTQVQLFRTTDGGTSWTEYAYPPNAGPIHKFSFPNSNTGYAACFGFVIKTTNSGANWVLAAGLSSFALTSIAFINETTGYAGEYDEIFKTTNGGANWTPNIIPYYAFNSGNVQSICTVNSTLIYILSSSHIILKSTSSGANWTALTSGYYEPLKAIYFTNQSTGYLGGWSNKIRKTINGGLNWFETSFPYSSYIYGIHFTDVNTGFAVGGNSGKGYIFKTTNAGSNWIKTDSMGAGANYAVSFINSSTGFVLGYSGEIWRTSNAGNNWIVYNSGVAFSLNSIFFTDNQTGYACGGVNPKVIKTTNSGLNWFDLYSAPGTQMNKIIFLNPSTGYICGTGVKKTTDAGATWNQVFTNLSIKVYDIWLIGNSNIYASAETGKFYKSTDGGINWDYADLPLNYHSAKLYFLDQNTGFILSDQGSLIRTTNGGGPVSIKTINKEVPREYVLSQNYPNPFNPSTTIEFDIPNKSFVTLSLYDITGREVESLVNELVSPGRYIVLWNAANYSSGVYFYTIRTESFQQTKRMVLVK